MLFKVNNHKMESENFVKIKTLEGYLFVSRGATA
jgi:hypothetical protein